MTPRALRHLFALLGVAVLVPFAACANGTDVPDLTGDGTDDGSVPPDDATVVGDSSAAKDAHATADANCPDGHTGSGCASCATGLHACGATCVSKQANFPEAGCAVGCGTACANPASGVATCNDAGTCDIGCAAGQVRDGGSCGCAAGERLCTDGACHACCADADCPDHVACNPTTHVCGGCAANFGDCDGNQANGCESSLTTTDNCGFCGSSCCTGFGCGCGFLGFGGEKCDQSGTSYNCGC